ncbi:sensor histidine kinase [Chitinophaga rhizophila]|uniref:Histidine kinase n=1 Tax=Chitinophaga rhizophila TaxID=2866212 RepID=A0ABS7GEE1_9BACT|nr:histidine kinase [Chitinophaga rhizophila]MBW8686035.1 histidine kinase [Chitinophaga rhizophila]
MAFCSNILNAVGWPYWVFFLLSLIVICSVFYLRERRIRQASTKEISRQQQLIHLEMHAFQAQMDPHFIFNSLNAIHHYILTTSTDLASLYLTRFARLMRLLIRNCNKQWVNLEEDIEALELYLQLEQLRFGSQFDYKVDIAPEVFQQVTFIPPLIIQPYIQEAIWRRLLLRPAKSGGCLHIRISRQHEMLHIRIEDNGISQEPLSPESHLARGINIAAARLSAINERYNMSTGITQQELYNDLKQPSGHVVIIKMQQAATRESAM